MLEMEQDDYIRVTAGLLDVWLVLVAGVRYIHML